MADRNVEDAIRLFTWRIQSNSVSPWEFEQIKKSIEEWDEWCAVWSEWAEKHVKEGDQALARDRRITAGKAYIRAGLFYHWASFLFTHDQEQFLAALEAMDECWRKAAPHLDPPMELVEIPFENTFLPGYLRRPHGVEQPPIVLLVPGGDSTKEELFDLADHILSRGLAVLAFDGPGHGKVSTRLKIRPDFEVPISAVIDYVTSRTDLDNQRLAVGGLSFGGLFACRAAAFDERVKAALSMSSWYSPAGLWPSMAPVSQIALKQYMGQNAPEVLNNMTLAGVAERIRVPLLQVYGGLDPVSPPEQAHRVAAEVQGPHTTVVFDDGVHVCNNVHYLARPLVADWLAETL
jgi:2,6-dihydroxypseudooxynicotine hydrolase